MDKIRVDKTDIFLTRGLYFTFSLDNISPSVMSISRSANSSCISSRLTPGILSSVKYKSKNEAFFNFRDKYHFLFSRFDTRFFYLIL